MRLLADKLVEFEVVDTVSYQTVRRALKKAKSSRVPGCAALATEVTAWQDRRNAAATSVNWRFTTADARIKLKRLFPSFDE